MPRKPAILRHWRWVGAGGLFCLTLLWALRAPGGSQFDFPHAWQCDYWLTSDGLPNHDVLSLAQTADGYIWIGMVGPSNNPARFNGFEFIPGLNAEGDAGRCFTCFAPGAGGRLWISRTSNGGSLTLWKDGRATPVNMTLPRPTGGGVESLPLHEDAQGNLWIGGAGLKRRSPDGQILDLSDQARAYGFVRCIVSDATNTLWMATDNGLVRLRDGHFDQPYPITNIVLSLFMDRQRNLWVGADTEPSLYCVSAQGECRRFGAAEGLKSKGVAAFCEDHNGDLWFGTYAGLYYVKEGEIHLVEDTELRTAFIFCLLCDQEGSLWVGTSDGLYHCFSNPIRHYGAATGLGAINSLAIGPSGLWVNVFSRGAFLLTNGVWIKRPELDEAGDDGELIETASGDVWMTGEHGCDFFKAGQPMRREPIGPDARFCQNEQGLWVVNETNVFAVRGSRLDPQGPGWPEINITAVVSNRGPGLLLGTTEGVYRWDGALTPWLKLGKDVPGAKISGMAWEGETLWVATDRAMARYDGNWRVIPSEAGLSLTGGINSLLAADRRLWLGCVNGLFCMNGAEADQYFCGATRDVTLIQYGKAQGMHAGYLGASSRGGGAVEDAAGGLWFASKSGLVGVDARELLNSRPPRVVIESVLLNGSPAPDWLFPGGSTLQIPAGARSIIFRYTALTYVSPHIVAYKYRLRGLDTDWIPAGNNREARFTTLPPGDYELEVAARNAGGMWSDEVARVRFTQEPFFYQTRAFSILAWLGGTLLTAVIVGLATAALHAISVRKMRRKVELLEAQQALLRERARIARDIHDDVGSTLTRIVLLSELATREPSQTYGPEGHLEGIRSAAREITRRLDEIVWAVNPRNDTLEALATYICKYVSDQARAAGLQCRLELPEVVPVWPLSGVTRHNIFLAVKEAVHNAVKHASARQIHLRLALQEKSITLEIADDGGGFADVGGEAEGDGLRNMRMRMTNLGGRCEIQSVPGRGTIVSLGLSHTENGKHLSTK